MAESVGQAFETLVELQQEGLIRHLGISNATTEQVAEVQTIAPIVSVQNMFNLAVRGDDDLIDQLAAEGIAYVPFFPLGGFSPPSIRGPLDCRDTGRRHSNGRRFGLAASAVADILLIPGTSSVAHLRENVAGAALTLTPDDLAELDQIGR